VPQQPRGGLADVIGVYKCWSCDIEIPVRLSNKGNLSAPCHFCGFPQYAIAGSPHFDNLRAEVRIIDTRSTSSRPSSARARAQSAAAAAGGDDAPSARAAPPPRKALAVA